ncbi:TlpA family protein disulfide reductase [Nitritalea halalkaliphila]|nr:TlpA family protein disulfide reductase [Nitritalea halalkaliphila]
MKKMLSLSLVFLLASYLVFAGLPAKEDFRETLNTHLEKEGLAPIAEGEIVVINLWATWCGPCIKEIPELNELVEKYEGKAVRFIALTKEDRSIFDRYVERKPDFSFLYEHSFNNLQALELIAAQDKKYQGRAIPLHAILDAEGKLVEVFVGASPENTAKIANFLAKNAK